MAERAGNDHAGLFHAGPIDFGQETVAVRVGFTGAQNADLGLIRADGRPIGAVALNGRATEPETEAVCRIDPTSGVRDVTVEARGDARVLSVAPADPSACPPYVPVPEERLTPLGSETWEATDHLGRKAASAEDVRGARADRKVGIFYWTWHEAHADLRPVDVVRVLDRTPAAEYRADHPAWGKRPFQCFWHEPLFGFYRDSDPYVIRRHAALLTAAGVDFLMLDCTNGALLWRDAYEPLFRGLREAREDGIRTPQVAFMMNFAPQKTTELMLRALYQNLYQPGLYRDLWFRLDGKPLVMAYPEALPAEGACAADTRTLDEIRRFFTFRPGQPLYAGGPSRPDQWGWLELFPQHPYGARPDGGCEMVTVGVAQNANAERVCTHFNDRGTFGRSYTARDGFARLTPDSYRYGYNVQEQWERALDLDPDIVFVTGWNEWIMGQFREPWLSDRDSTQLAMVDQYDREHSRDIEPDRDGYLDAYYLQLAHNIRRFKGAAARAPASPAGAAGLTSDERTWAAVAPAYRNPKGLTLRRDYPGFGGIRYVNDSGRNDLVEARVSRDDRFLFFRVVCAEPVSPPEGENWMVLYLDADRSKRTGWEGYDFAVNRLRDGEGRVVVERYLRTADAGSFTWEAVGTAAYRVDGRALTLAVPRALVGLAADPLDFEFKWSDGMREPNAMDFYVNGSAAPIGRFNYRYRT